MLTRRLTIYCLAVALISAVACMEPEGIGRRETKPPPVREPPRPKHPVGDIREVTRHCDGKNCYIFDWDVRRWYIEGTEPKKYIEGNPPNLPDFDRNQPRPMEATLPDRKDLGLEPNENGEVSPALNALNYRRAKMSEFSTDDRVDLLFVAEHDWELPFDNDPLLLASIGEENIEFFDQAIAPEEPSAPLLVRLNGITVGDAIAVLDKMHVHEVAFRSGHTDYSVKLDGPLESYSYVLLYKGGELSMKIKIR